MNIIKYKYHTIQDGFIHVINNPVKEIVEYNEHDFPLIETHLSILGCDFKRSEYAHDNLFFFSVCCWLNKNTDYFSQKTSPSGLHEDEMSAASEGRQSSLQSTATKTPAMSAQQEKRNAPAEQAPAEQMPAEQVPTIKVTITDKLIAYLDDAGPDIPETPSINITDKLIAYLPADTPATAPAESAPRPKWTYVIEDLWNGVQLAYTERQNEIIDIFTNKN